jgi:glycosyltransferase involved in cell wall biosynthesis
LDQNYQNLEYVVIDGASTDGTLDIIKKYEGTLSRIVSEPDKGLYDAFNKGFKLASGDIIGILNSDDFHAPWALETVAKAYVANQEADVFFGKVVHIDKTDSKWLEQPLGSASKIVSHRLSISFPAIFIAKRAYDKWGFFDDNYKIAGDWDYLLRMYLGGAKFIPLDVVLGAFRMSGISSTLSRNHWDEVSMVYKKNFDKQNARSKTMNLIKDRLKYYVSRAMKSTGTYWIYTLLRYHKLSIEPLWNDYNGNPEQIWNTLRIKS